MRNCIVTLAAIMTLGTAACGGARRQAAADGERTTLTVRNDNYLDHNIYLLVSSERVRLGTARGLTTTRFVIPRQYVFGVASLAFMADPIGSRVTPVTERINVSPGDEVQLIIPAR
jgi:hypothetical protein